LKLSVIHRISTGDARLTHRYLFNNMLFHIYIFVVPKLIFFYLVFFSNARK
jgi:hypothetical protein